mmetsp:Transcript_16077/g.24014  ORF Transcript_16077/g.24014 Transcript_16077/m.24014 type:complete len:212 (-) Transcript_16077:152-787(-)
MSKTLTDAPPPVGGGEAPPEADSKAEGEASLAAGPVQRLVVGIRLGRQQGGHLRGVRVVVVVDHPLLHRAVGVFPGLFKRCLTAGCAQVRVHHQEPGLLQVAPHAGLVRRLVVRVRDALVHGEPLDAVGDQVRRALLFHDRRDPGPQCLERHVPKGLDVRGEEQYVGAGVGLGQVEAAQPAHHRHAVEALEKLLARSHPDHQAFDGQALGG